MPKFETRRNSERIRMAVPVKLDQGTGITRDVSSTGVYFYTEQHYSPGMPLAFTLELEYVFPNEPVLLHCRGRVVRVEEEGERNGVAASISEFWNAA